MLIKAFYQKTNNPFCMKETLDSSKQIVYLTKPSQFVPITASNYINTRSYDSCEEAEKEAKFDIEFFSYLRNRIYPSFVLMLVKKYLENWFKTKGYSVAKDEDYVVILTSGDEELTKKLMLYLMIKDALGTFINGMGYSWDYKK